MVDDYDGDVVVVAVAGFVAGLCYFVMVALVECSDDAVCFTAAKITSLFLFNL